MKKRWKIWTMGDRKKLASLIHLTDKELVSHFPGTTVHSIEGARMRFGLLKSKEEKQFKKGHKPWNTGKNICQGGRSVETQFKKGRKPHHARPMYEVFRVDDKNNRFYLCIKLPHKRAYLYSRYVWEQNTGESLTSNDVIRYRDKNALNCDISNLYKVTRAENCQLNSNRPKAEATKKAQRKQVKEALAPYFK